jgi:Uma2 family endonuclease
VLGDERLYLTRHPTPQDIGLIVEVADTSLDRDRDDKGPVYARAGIPHYWIVNLIDMQVEVYGDLSGPSAPSAGYRSRVDCRPGDSVQLILRGQYVGVIPARDLLP